MRCLAHLRPRHLRRFQNAADLAKDRSHGAKVIRIAHQGNERRDDADRKYDHGHQVLRSQRSALYQQPADGQHRNHCRRHDHHGKGKGDDAGSHPVDVTVRRLIGVVHKAVIAGSCLAEGLDNLDPADVLHRRIVERLGGCDGALIEFSASRHHEHITEHPQRHCDKAGQPHSPVDGKNVDKNDDGDQQVRGKLRHDMRQRRLDAVDPLDQCVFQRTGALFKHRAQGHTGQLLRTTLSYLAKYSKCRLVAGGCTQGME